ncbi:MAG: hypothetical protein A3I75_07025 [Deltaproteobacteria bacterium RIFCSPLOWO2_02_FULL_50_16]|nr:MAG: hypothetical protein A3I75_07025 [Deltaproteobacteria bacterium RIFCSPLOWO2_02_FULL_50_16]OGQ68921.1 MAG: hypothetical protein A3F89_02745 [Deltaproteobacteria bacterium RIFCSPLOWO2_12_FULL_50_11]
MMAHIIKGNDVDPMATLTGDLKRPQGTVSTGLPPRGVIKREVLSATGEAERILNQAKKEAAHLIHQAQEVLKGALKHVESERAAGYERGHQEGLSQVTELMTKARYEYEKSLQEAEGDIVALVMQIAEKIIGNAIEQGAIVDIVKQALQGAVGHKIIVRLHPDDLMRVRSHEAELKNKLDHQQTLQLREDESVIPGGCLIETEVGTIDAQLPTQLAAIKKALGLGS